MVKHTAKAFQPNEPEKGALPGSFEWTKGEDRSESVRQDDPEDCRRGKADANTDPANTGEGVKALYKGRGQFIQHWP
jgi:hypothetical protein